MAGERIIDLPSGSIIDTALGFIGDPVTGALSNTTYLGMKGYFQQGISSSIGNTGSFVLTSSYHIDSASFNNQISNVSNSIVGVFASQSYYESTSSFNAYTASTNLGINSLTSSLQLLSSSFDNFTSSYYTTSASFNTGINSVSSSLGTVSASYNLDSASFNTRINANSSSFTTFSGSYIPTSASFDSRISSITGSVSASTVFGQIYNKNSWTNLSDFSGITLTASITPQNTILISGGTGTFGQTMSIGVSSSYLEHWSITANVTISSSNSTSYGVGIGMLSTNTTFPVSPIGSIDFTNIGGEGGHITLTQVQNGSSTALAAAGTLSFNVNDQITLVVERASNTIQVKAQNFTSSSAWISAIYTYLLDGSVTPQTPNTGRYAIWSLGGSFIINSLNVSSTEQKNSDYCFIGDSKTAGSKASLWSNRYFDLFNLYYPNSINVGGNADKLEELLNRTSEIIALNPKIIMMNMGSNSIRAGDSSTVYNALYDQAVSTFVSAGIRVVHLTTFYETSLDVSPLVNHVTSSYSASNIIDTYTALKTTSGVLAPDGVHPNNSGQFIIFKTIQKAGKSILPYGFYNHAETLERFVVDTTVPVATYNFFTGSYTTTSASFNTRINAITGSTIGVSQIGFGNTNNSITSSQNLIWNNASSSLTVSGTSYFSNHMGVGLPSASAFLHITGSSISAASLRINSGSAPSSPNDGDIWYDAISGSLKMQINGALRTFTLI